MITPREENLVKKGQSLAVLNLLQEIESLYAYTGIPPELQRVMDEYAEEYDVYSYQMPIILLPLHPKWASLILDKKKTRECRLSFPSVVGPFKCLIYETKVDGGRGMIVGEFICRGKDDYLFDPNVQMPISARNHDPNGSARIPGYWITSRQREQLCLTVDEIFNYGKGRNLYGWHIDEVYEYPKPLPLSNFARPNSLTPLTKPPQSYFEVWEL